MGGVEAMTICANCLGCGGQGGGDSNSPYAYEVFKKVPFFGSISNYLRFAKGGQNTRNSGAFSTITNMIRQSWGDQIGFFKPGGVPSGPTPPPGPGGILNIMNIANLLPIGQANPQNTSLFDLVGDETFVRKIRKSVYHQTVKKLQGTDEKYTDQSFPPHQSSLGDLKSRGTDPSRIQWKRLHEIIAEPVFCKDQFQPGDILQGQLGDCYFLSALSSLAEEGYRIKSLFASLEVSKNGIYMARILHNGEYQQVVIDDYFPVNQKGKVFFAQPAGGIQIWVMVLQKCWAKLYGSYAEIIGGLPNEVLHAFSSAPVYYHPIPSSPDKQEVLWRQMLKSQTNGSLLCCGTKSDAAIEQYGFVKGHAYTVLGVYDKPMRLIKLRNPWGHKEWKGRASDYDLDFWNQISATDKQLLHYEDVTRKQDKDGIFFVVWQDFLKYFSLVDICKLNDNAHYNFVQTDFQNLTPQLFEFEVRGSKPELLTIAITQPNKRGTTQKSYSRNFAALGKWDQASQSYKYVKTRSTKSFADNFLQIDSAEPGKYLLYSKYNWSKERTKGSAVVNVYSVAPSEIVENKNVTPETFLKQIFYDHASKNSRRKQLPGTDDWVCSDILLNQGGFSYFVANIDKNSKGKLGVTLHESEYTEKRLVLQSPYKGKDIVNQEVTPGKPIVVVAELLDDNFPTSITNPTPKVVPLQ